MEPSSNPTSQQKLLKELKWITLDLQNDRILDIVYEFLKENYVEDSSNTFRLRYSKDFFKHALFPPNNPNDLVVGLSTIKSDKLVGFITAVQKKVYVNNDEMTVGEVNFLCIHKKLRNNNFCTLLINEITKRLHEHNIKIGLHTSGKLLGKVDPITSSTYFHKFLNVKKLVETGFMHINPNISIDKVIKLHELKDNHIMLRLANVEDELQMFELFKKYVSTFDIYPKYTRDEFNYWFKIKEDVSYTYVVSSNGNVTDFVSIFCLPTTVLNNVKYNELKIAYIYYVVTTETSSDKLIGKLALMLKNQGYDLINALDNMDNIKFIKANKFMEGDGKLHYYIQGQPYKKIDNIKNALVLF